jgi:acetylornithine deacetylase/succinyl-diaminopimelate desuccinylase-like protein
MTGAAHPTGSSHLRGEVTELLQALLRLNTVNPPGNETRAAELIRDRLARDGIACTLVGRVPERMNLVARLPGGDGPSLMLTGHTDTVVADPAEWSRDPWCGDLVDGEVWGRGALDMKSHVAAAVVAFASLAREGARLPGDLLLVVVADEEVGDDFGMSWLVREHPELVRADFAINEGAGDRVVLGGRPFYLCSVGEKMTAPFRVRLRGRSGHASDPYAADNALLKAGPVLEALARIEPTRELIPEVRAFLEVVLGEVPPLDHALARAAALDPLAAELIRPLLGATLSPTMIQASVQRNVIPARCTIEVDCRMLPGASTAEVEVLLRAGVPGDWELEWVEREVVGGTRSPLDTPLWRSLAAWVEATDPGASLAPICGAGFTDSHYLRQSLGTCAYGFFPLKAMSSELAARLVHSADERVPVDDLELAVDAFRHAALTVGA